ncbi:MAG: glycoside hydrolase family 31 protein, partial [Clostridia bacterium]
MIELKDYQKLRMAPMANSQATITKKGMRLTVLTDGLLRIEKSKGNNFVDDATQTVINRDLPLVEFSVEEKGNRLFVKTKRCVFELNLVTCKCVSVRFGDKKVHCDNRQNLKGTTRTLDGAFSAMSLENGVLSKNGVAVLFDSKSLIINNDRYLEKRKTQEKDMYIFAFLNDYLGAIDALYKITGAPPLLPRFVFGNWWSRYKKYSQDEYIALMDEFAEKKIPLTVATVDMDWHWVDVVKQFGKEYKLPFGQNSGWTGYSFNTDLFYDYKKFLAELKARS